MTNHTASAAAVQIAPLGSDRITVMPRCGLPQENIEYPSCDLEGYVLTLQKGDFEILREVWVEPDNLAAMIKARRIMYPGWTIFESYQIAPWDDQKWIGF
ncbi:MAG: hypothetical protein AAGE59_38045 [Cyanobacteria bacterium P01_F01_bin.86]